MRALLLVAVAIAVTPALARAQPNLQTQTSFNPQLFHPAPGPDQFVTIEPAAPLPHAALGAGLYFD